MNRDSPDCLYYFTNGDVWGTVGYSSLTIHLRFVISVSINEVEPLVTTTCFVPLTDDPVEMAFKKAYRRMDSKARRKRIPQSEFYHWSELARKKRDECYEGIITLKEYRIWLEADKGK